MNSTHLNPNIQEVEHIYHADEKPITEFPSLFTNIDLDKETFKAKVKELLQQYEKNKPLGIFF